MGDGTGIEWTDATWNPIRGCSKVSDGCKHCYAETVAARFSGPGQPYAGTISNGRWNGEILIAFDRLSDPLRWKKPRRIFVNSMSDLFHEEVADETISRIFSVMNQARQHTFQILTKRAKRMQQWVSRLGCELPNVWLGVSVEHQAAADERIPLLLDTPAAVRFLSCEPLLGAIDLLPYMIGNYLRHENGAVRVVDGGCIGWVIAGGESGAHARPMHPHWVRQLRDQCSATQVPFFFKQWGEWAPLDMPWSEDETRPLQLQERWLNLAGGEGFHGDEVWRMRRIGKKLAGNQLDSRTWQEFPA